MCLYSAVFVSLSVTGSIEFCNKLWTNICRRCHFEFGIFFARNFARFCVRVERTVLPSMRLCCRRRTTLSERVYTDMETRTISKRAYTVFVLVAARAVPLLCVLPGIARGLDGVGYVPKLLRCVLLADQRDRIMLVATVLTVVPCAVVILCYSGVLLYVLVTACRLKITTARKELRITAVFGAIFLVVVGGFTPYSVVRSIDRRYQLHADVYLAVSVCYGVATCSPLLFDLVWFSLIVKCILF